MRFWIAVVGKSQNEEVFASQNWWCLEKRAQKGDFLLGYRTSSADKINNGIFALCELFKDPDPDSKHSNRCYPYGPIGKLHFTEMKFISSFKHRVTYKELKDDPVLSDMSCVRRKFQGTIFEITKDNFKRILQRSGEKFPEILAN